MILLSRDVYYYNYRRGLLWENNGLVNFWLIPQFFASLVVHEETEVDISHQHGRNSPVTIATPLQTWEV